MKPTQINSVLWVSEEQRARDLEAIVEAYARRPEIRHAALTILRGKVPGINREKTARVIAQWIRANVPYRLEHGEQIETPGYILRNPKLGADCDGHAILMASLARSVGVPTRLHFWRPTGTQHAVHVSSGFHDGREWVNVETTERRPLGWVPSRHEINSGAGWAPP
jgi:transglutaminase-like putative cysteine protease